MSGTIKVIRLPASLLMMMNGFRKVPKLRGKRGEKAEYQCKQREAITIIIS
jgi:hypothetical protein